MEAQETQDCIGPDQPVPTSIHIIRHGQSLHNVERGYPHRDPQLTEKGQSDAKCIRLPCDGELPDLILISPMTRTIQTAILAFPRVFEFVPFRSEVQVWPELREAHDATCNKGVSRPELINKFPGFDFSRCPSEWNHPPHDVAGAKIRAEAVRKQLESISRMGKYRNIALVTHRGFIAFLVGGDRFDMCETRSYRFATAEETDDHALRFRTNIDTGELQDFGPTMLLPNLPDGDTAPRKVLASQ